MTIMRLSLDVSNYIALERNLTALAHNTDRRYAPSFLVLTDRAGYEHKCTAVTMDGSYIQLADPFGETDRVLASDIYKLEVFWQ